MDTAQAAEVLLEEHRSSKVEIGFCGIRQQLRKFSVGMYIGVVTVLGGRHGQKVTFPKLILQINNI